jgi:hypothetical protein
MLTSAQVDEISTFITTYPGLYKMITDASIGEVPMNTIYKMSKNMMITHKIYEEKYDCRRFFSINEAISQLNRDNILVIVQEIGTYLLFDEISNYHNLVNSIFGTINHYDTCDFRNNTFSPYQIVLKDQPQKIVFFAKDSNDNDVDRIKEVCKKLFNTDILVLKADGHTEFTLLDTPSAKSFTDTTVEFGKLTEKLTKYHNNLANVVQLPPINKTMLGDDYIIYYVGNTNTNSIEYATNSLMKYLPSKGDGVTSVTVNVTTNITGNNNNINTGSGNIKVKKLSPEKRLKITEEWINNNLPEDSIGSSDYYNLYRDNCNIQPISPGKFNDFVSNLGYNKQRKDNINYWIKNK